MTRYIKADALEKEGWTLNRTYSQDSNTMVYEIKKLSDFPTADAVEVVRCKDCKLWHYDDLFNEGWCVGRMTEPDYFCADGKRKDGEQDEL